MSEPRQTRHWDAWTREEEENFFGALREVGKNFEKITSRVQSKNKDQVRHYYYRVIKRMNRILAPTLVLDAKNSAFVNLAMLRWWSLLEKHSCSASKLRLKPRRFKSFVTALEQQLLKDHKKAKIKKPTPAASQKQNVSQVEMAVVVPSGLSEVAASGSGAVADDLVGAQTAVPVRKSATKRKAASSTPRKSVPKVEGQHPPRPRKKATDSNVSKAVLAAWEKGASIGVSHMLGATGQLESTKLAGLILPASETSEIRSVRDIGGTLINVDVQTGQIPLGSSAVFSGLGFTGKTSKAFAPGLPLEMHGLGGVKVSPLLSAASSTPPTTMPIPPLNGTLPNVCKEATGGLIIIPELCAQVKAKALALDGTRCNNCSTLRCNGVDEVKTDTSGGKLKLQLFPFDDFIRRALEQDGHNPHLELTFKPRKSISSVLHHIAQKWGRSTAASGELHLFPFSTQWSDVSASQSWSIEDASVTAADVYAALGNPVVFRLRYAWLSTRVLESSAAVLQQPSIRACLCEPSVQMESPPVPAGGCQGEDPENELRPMIPSSSVRGVNSDVAIPSVDLIQRSSRCLDREPGHQIADKLTFSDGVQSTIVELSTDKAFVQPVLDLASFGADGEDVHISNCKEKESASQMSPWLYESNDGFAQQLWNDEDGLRNGDVVSLSQMDWVDSLTNISVSELLGDPSRVDCLQPPLGQVPLASLDSFDLCIAGRELPTSGPMSMPITQHSSGPMSMPVTQHSSGMWGGEDTCDAFSFQKLDSCKQGTVNALDQMTTVNALDEVISANSLGLDVTNDFRSIAACWREGDSMVGFDVGQQPENSESQDLLFNGEASMGLGGLIEALAQGSLDGFHACSVDHNVDGAEDHGAGQDCGGCTKARVGSADFLGNDVNAQLPSGDFCEPGRVDDDLTDSIELTEDPDHKLTETPLLNVAVSAIPTPNSPKQKRPANGRLQRNKELHPPQRSFKLPGQFSAARSLKLQG